MQLFVTVLEGSEQDAVRAIAAIGSDHDGVEVRAERFPALDPAALRAATRKPLILTFRGRGTAAALEALPAAAAAGIDFVDVEWRPGLDRKTLGPFADRVVLSHHDFLGMRDAATLFAAMLELRCAHVKLAATPRTLRENVELLALLAGGGERGRTVIGMGERGLYSRLVAPFRGSALAFVSHGAPAAPGQLPLEQALRIYGERSEVMRAAKTFAVAGNPAGHSLSPAIHNPLFREKGASAAYTIASFERFDEVAEALVSGEPAGVSVTAPFKPDAYEFARGASAAIGADAADSGVANTLVRAGGGFLADNTDVAGFAALLSRICGRDRKSVAIVGAGGTARAAKVAAEREAMHVTVFNRTPGKLGALPLAELERWDGEILIDTTSAELELPLRAGMTYIRAAYGSPSRTMARCEASGVQVFDGLDLLEAQAVRQNEIFMRAFDGP